MLAADPGVTIADDGSTRFHLRFVANSASDDGHVEIRQIYFPGWRARIDGKSLAPGVLASHLTPQGLMQVPVPAGRHSIEARYDGPPGWRWRAVLAWLALITVPLVSARFYRFSVKAC